MNRLASLTIYVLACVALAGLVVACAGTQSKEQESAAVAFQETFSRAMADGIVTPEEAAEIEIRWKAWRTAPSGPGIGTIIGAAAGTVALSLYPGLRLILPLIANRHILGTEPDPEVARVAGAPKPTA